MLIECPICNARAQIPSSKEGAKVRCGECGRVYVARPPGSKADRSQPNTGAIIGIGVAVVALVVFVIIYRSSSGSEQPTQAATKTDKPEAPAYVDDMGWDGPSVRLAVRLHETVFDYDEAALRPQLHAANIWVREELEVTAAAEAEAEATDTAATTIDDFHLLPQPDKDALLDRTLEQLLRGEDRELVGEWVPYDGSVAELSDDDAIVRLALRSREPGNVEKRMIEWKLTRDGTKWKAWSWERWYSPEELAANRRRINRGYEKVTLSDGSKVFERTPEPLEHLEDTPPEVRARIDALYATMIDLDLTKEGTRAQAELIEIGRPSIPILLTGLYEIPLETEDQAKQVNLIVIGLRSITGQYMGFKPMMMEGSGVGTTEERRQSAIKQWFAWWWRKQDKFIEKETTDGLEGLIELTEKEKRWLERHKDD
jgi:predicted Zn finger-like uncharacterized protein